MSSIEQKSVQDIVQDNMMDYSYSVLTDRAIPTIQDGLKPVARRIMFTLKKHKIDKFTKSMNVTGLISAVHPHGTTYDTIVGMVQKDNWQIPLIDGHGNFSQYASRDLQAGADRYTEVKISEFGKEMTKLIGTDVINEIPNYDGTIMMPVVIPVTFPLVLTQSQSGIGVGYASSTLSYNMKEVAKEIERYIKKRVVNPIYPDFPTGGYILKDSIELENGLIGKSSFTLRAKIESVDKQTIRITEIPYGVKYETIIDKIIALVKNGKLTGVIDVKDLNDYNGLTIEVYTRKNAKHDDLISKLYKYTQLENKVNSNPVLIDLKDGNPRVYGMQEVIKVWVDWRLEVYQKELINEINRLQNEYYYLSALKSILGDVNRTISIIRKSSKETIVSNIMNGFDLEEKQARYVINMKIYNINEDYISDKLKNIDEIDTKISKLTELSQDSKLMLSNISEQVMSIANKYGVKRQTEVLNAQT